MAAPTSSRPTNSCSRNHRVSKPGGRAMNLLCKLLLWSCLCCLLAKRVYAKAEKTELTCSKRTETIPMTEIGSALPHQVPSTLPTPYFPLPYEAPHQLTHG